MAPSKYIGKHPLKTGPRTGQLYRKSEWEKVDGEKQLSRIIRRQILDGKKMEKGGISNMGGEKLAETEICSWRDLFFGGGKGNGPP